MGTDADFGTDGRYVCVSFYLLAEVCTKALDATRRIQTNVDKEA